MNESKSVTKDLICGMTVDEATALRAERDEPEFRFRHQQRPATAESETVNIVGSMCSTLGIGHDAP